MSQSDFDNTGFYFCILYVALKRLAILASYLCRVLKKIWYFISTAAGVEVDCGQDEMTITLPKSLLLGLDREHLRLIDANCTATENKTHFFLHTETGKCGTILKHNKDYVIYSNMVSEIPIEENKIVTRLRQAMIPFHCFYSNWGAVSSIGIRPSGTKIVFSSRGFGKFTLSLDLFRSSQ